jgi:hypothetical protein
MRKRLLSAAVWAAGVLTLIGGAAVVGRTAPEPSRPELGPSMKRDTGAGEMLVVVLGGVFASRAEAEAANAAMRFGDVQGYYVVPVAQFQGFKEQLGAPGDQALVSVFRTEIGAREFASLASAMGYPAEVLPTRVRSLGGVYAGLGQEAAPDGSGPLVGPIADSLP